MTVRLLHDQEFLALFRVLHVLFQCWLQAVVTYTNAFHCLSGMYFVVGLFIGTALQLKYTSGSGQQLIAQCKRNLLQQIVMQSNLYTCVYVYECDSQISLP